MTSIPQSATAQLVQVSTRLIVVNLIKSNLASAPKIGTNLFFLVVYVYRKTAINGHTKKINEKS